jgi:nitrogenase iron protein NifH
MECYPDSEMAEEYRTLTENILKICREDGLC